MSVFNSLNLIKQSKLTYCVQCRRKNIENLDSKIFKTKNKILTMQPKCAVYGIKRSIFLQEQEPKGLLSSLGIETPLNKIPLLGDIFF